MHDPLHNPQPEIVYQLIGNWYLSVINHVSIVSRLKVSSCVNSKQSTQTLGQTANCFRSSYSGEPWKHEHLHTSVQ